MDDALGRFLELISPFARVARGPTGGVFAFYEDLCAGHFAIVFRPPDVPDVVVFHDESGRPVAAAKHGWFAIHGEYAAASFWPPAAPGAGSPVLFAGEPDGDAVALVAHIAEARGADRVVAPEHVARAFGALPLDVVSRSRPETAAERLVSMLCEICGTPADRLGYAPPLRIGNPWARARRPSPAPEARSRPHGRTRSAIGAVIEYDQRDPVETVAFDTDTLRVCVDAMERHGAPLPAYGDAVGLAALIERVRHGTIDAPWPRIWQDGTHEDLTAALFEAAATMGFREIHDGDRVWTVFAFQDEWLAVRRTVAVPGRVSNAAPAEVHRGWPSELSDLARDATAGRVAIRPHDRTPPKLVVPYTLSGQLRGFLASQVRTALARTGREGTLFLSTALTCAASYFAAPAERRGASVVYRLPVTFGALSHRTHMDFDLWPARLPGGAGAA